MTNQKSLDFQRVFTKLQLKLVRTRIRSAKVIADAQRLRDYIQRCRTRRTDSPSAV
jgi:hypothetical protein